MQQPSPPYPTVSPMPLCFLCSCIYALIYKSISVVAAPALISLNYHLYVGLFINRHACISPCHTREHANDDCDDAQPVHGEDSCTV